MGRLGTSTTQVAARGRSGGARRVMRDLTQGLGGTCRLAVAALVACAALVAVGAVLSLVGAVLFT